MPSLFPRADQLSHKMLGGMMRKMWLIAFVLLLAAVVYLSLRPLPSIVTVPYFPHPLAAWFDRHDVLKNMIGFGTLAFAGFQAFLPNPRSMPVKKRLIVSLSLITFVTLLITGLELAQTQLPRRSCDPRDLVAGGLGVVLAWIAKVIFRGRRPRV
jgi:hypothetical protein